MPEQTKPNDGGPAFPVPTISGPDLTVSYPEHVRGMTLRDYYAAHASVVDVDRIWFELQRLGQSKTYEECRFIFADRMLAAWEARNV